MPASVVDAVKSFLDLACDRPSVSNEELYRALDTLVEAYHNAPPCEPSDRDDEPPSHDYPALRQTLGAKFTDLGYYNAGSRSEPLAQSNLVGDALDDLTDIVQDLRDIAWRSSNLGEDDAIWWFRWSFESHWGLHLRSLSLYLHETIY